MDDPFRPLEDDSAETRAWQAAQNEAADASLRGWDGFAALCEAVTPHLTRTAVTAPARRGASWLRREGGRLVAAASPVGEGRTLVDPGDASLDWFHPSPRGTFVAYGLSHMGDEQSVLHVVETATGSVLPDRIPFTSNATVAWLPDESGFVVNAGVARDFDRVDKVLLVHRLGQEGPSEPEPIEVREPYCVRPQVSPDGRHLVALTSEVEPRADWIRELDPPAATGLRGDSPQSSARAASALCGDSPQAPTGSEGTVRADSPRGAWRPFLLDVDGTCCGVFDGDSYVAVCTERAPRGRLVRIPLASPSDRGAWEELVPEGDAVLRRVTRAAGLLVVDAVRDGCSVVLLVHPGGRVEELELPVQGAVAQTGALGVSQPATEGDGAGVAGDDDGFSFVLGAPDRSPALYRWEPRRGLQELRPPEALLPFTVTRGAATAPDGKRVAYEVVHRADLDPDGLPAVVYAYGGWNVALVRGSLGANAHLVEAGAALVLAHVRGGGEEGTAFHRDGVLERKQRSYDDVYAVAEEVARTGMADPARIAVLGGSNGGLMAAVALTQRPDLWRAACSLVPVTDMLRYHTSPYGLTGLREYGDPRDPDDAAVLATYSPCHNVVPGRRYPPTLVVAGANDMRCPAWHARKLVARLQAVAEGGPFVLRVTEGGHLSSRRAAESVAEWQGFLLRHLALAPTEAAA